MDEKEKKPLESEPAGREPDEPEYDWGEFNGCGCCRGCAPNAGDSPEDDSMGDSYGTCPCSSGEYGSGCEYVEN